MLSLKSKILGVFSLLLIVATLAFAGLKSIHKDCPCGPDCQCNPCVCVDTGHSDCCKCCNCDNCECKKK